jgi:predicted  nucleic acid-binding Zn-ribbon protein
MKILKRSEDTRAHFQLQHLQTTVSSLQKEITSLQKETRMWRTRALQVEDTLANIVTHAKTQALQCEGLAWRNF